MFEANVETRGTMKQLDLRSGFSDARLEQLARNQYLHGDAGFVIDPKKTALLMIDMQEEYVFETGGPYRVPEAKRRIPAMQRLLAEFRRRGLPVIHTAFSKTHLYQDRPLRGSLMPNRAADAGFDDSHLFQNAKFVPELQPLESEIVILKPSYGAFFDTPLETILKRNGLDTVVLAGILTDCCVGTTARQAYERGFGAIVVSDATAAALPEFHEAELNILRRSFARVLNVEQVVEAIDPRPA
jgi:nicotinamidase-related amidase